MATTTFEDARASSADEAGKWNWGAFLLSWLWAFWHRAWLWAILGLVPIVGVIVMFVLGAKGNEIALRNRDYANTEDFRHSQRKWATAGLLWYGLLFALGAISVAAG